MSPPVEESRPRPGASQGAGFGTFGGVFTPSILTILGVIMYLRFGWVVGNVGLIQTLIIVTICTSITALTALSMSSIATDRRVRAGGAYYMISRSLGVETGVPSGIPVYFALAFSVALYTIGFAESVVRVFPMLDQRMLAAGTTIVVAILAITSARLAIRAQYFIMAAIALSLLSFLFGGPLEETTLQLAAGARAERRVLGGARGVLPGGDRDRGRGEHERRPEGPGALDPPGHAGGAGGGLRGVHDAPCDPVAAGGRRARSSRTRWSCAAWPSGAMPILLGVWGATLSSALGSILGGPRVLQALARDNVLPRWMSGLGRGAGAADEPRIATIVTMLVALAAVSLGELNVIAPILTMFFLASYMTVNLAAGIEGLIRSPSFRPSFRVHWSLSLLGAVGCVVIMVLINPVATAAAAVVIGAVFLWLERREMKTAWGDVRRGVLLSLARSVLLRLGDDQPDPRNWRPHILVLSGAPTSRWHLVQLASDLTHNRGLLTVATVLRADSADARRNRKLEGTIDEYLGRRGVQALVRVVKADTPFDGAERLASTYGMGSLVPNTFILGASEEPRHREAYCRTLEMLHERRRNVVVLRYDPVRGFGDRRRIDIWWGGLQRNGGLMMLLAYLLRTSLRVE